uniref:Uncharacterized protein n=1 Tax=Tetraselmis sp. GSL018 TaxID=582737 RepID=A0A061RJS4_9CHLO
MGTPRRETRGLQSVSRAYKGGASFLSPAVAPAAMRLLDRGRGKEREGGRKYNPAAARGRGLPMRIPSPSQWALIAARAAVPCGSCWQRSLGRGCS